MKRIFYLTGLLLLFFPFCTWINAQNNTHRDDYHPLVQEGNKWNVLDAESYYNPQIPIPCYKYKTQSFMFMGDTTINDKEYIKLYTSLKKEPVFPQDWSLKGFMREDEKKVWYKDKNPNFDEKLYYDFSLEIGDTVPNPWGDYFSVVVVENISNEKLYNGEERKFFWLSSFHFVSNSKEYWIEGIGSMVGLIYPLFGEICGGFYEMLCFSEQNELLFFNTNYNTCYKGSVGIQDYENMIYIYPNPVKELIHIDNTNNLNIIGGSLINIQGQIIKQFESNTNHLDVSDISSGIYFIKFST